jgi:DHA1 family tetracycline resistance protein-like MFS transporter
MPALNALLSRQVPASSQGELQGGVAALYSLSSIVGPPLMTQLFRWNGDFPGAPFAFSAGLVLLSLGALACSPAGAARDAPI